MLWAATGLLCDLKQKNCGYLSSSAANISNSTIQDWQTYYSLWWFMIILFRSNFLVFMPDLGHATFHILAASNLCFLRASYLAGDGGFHY
jgi:hypothetical protein